jgi:hypothetical protein
MPSVAVLEALAVTAELLGATLSPAAARVLASDLEGIPDPAVLGALVRCRRELRPGAFCVAAILQRIEDGRPGVEQAWAMLPASESQTVVWTDEMVLAWAVAKPLLDDGERVAARMAFKETYTELVARRRDSRIPARWTASIGTDKAEAGRVIEAAVQDGRLPAPYAALLLPYNGPVAPSIAGVIAYKKMPQLEN